MSSDGPVGWDLAAKTAARFAPAGPQVSWTEASDAVTELRGLAVRAEEHVRAVTGLVPPGEPGEATVADRPGWPSANVDGFRVVLAPVVEKMMAKKPSATAMPSGGKVTGLQMGS